jgi:hypothetical protein
MTNTKKNEYNHITQLLPNQTPFESDSNYGTNKPLYDSACKFMCLNIEDALKYKEQLLKDFNRDDTMRAV